MSNGIELGRAGGGSAPLLTISISTNRPAAAAAIPSSNSPGIHESSCSTTYLVTAARSSAANALNCSMNSAALMREVSPKMAMREITEPVPPRNRRGGGGEKRGLAGGRARGGGGEKRGLAGGRARGGGGEKRGLAGWRARGGGGEKRGLAGWRARGGGGEKRGLAGGRARGGGGSPAIDFRNQRPSRHRAAESLTAVHRRLSSTSLSKARSAFAVVIKGLGVPIIRNTTEAITAPRIGATMKSQS